MAADVGKLLKSPLFWLKILELLLIFLMIALTVNGGYGTVIYPLGAATAHFSRCFVVFGTQYAWLIINVILIAGFMVDEVVSKKLTLLLTSSAAILFVTAGALEIEYWNVLNWPSDLTLGAGIVGLILGATFIVDTAYSFKFE
ncbi:hypothetical protein B566_EDAN017217 [Ephemera danica]|nr:hypothetical protein B566_EDAN017217 [Ephemera danica]